MISLSLLLLLAAGNDVKVPNDTDLYRFVLPGQEEQVVPSLFRHTTPTLSEITELDPYQQAGRASSASAALAFYVTDPSDATNQRVLMFYGIQNAKTMMLRKLVAINEKTAVVSQVSFSCVAYPGTAFSGMFSSRKRARSGDWWYACTATG